MTHSDEVLVEKDPVCGLIVDPAISELVAEHEGQKYFFCAARCRQRFVATPAVVWIAAPFFKRGWTSIVNRSPNMWTLIAPGTGAAYAYSVVATVFPGVFPPAFRMHDGTVPVYFEAAAVIIILVLLGQLMELRAGDRTGDAIKAQLQLSPKTAWRRWHRT